MKKVEIFDPAMCCSTGVCGPGIDPELMRIATLINTIEKKGIAIKRYNLSGNPQEFVSNKTVNTLLMEKGVNVLPVTLVDGVVMKKEGYPSKEEFAGWLGIEISSEPAVKLFNIESGGKGCC